MYLRANIDIYLRRVIRPWTICFSQKKRTTYEGYHLLCINFWYWIEYYCVFASSFKMIDVFLDIAVSIIPIKNDKITIYSKNYSRGSGRMNTYFHKPQWDPEMLICLSVSFRRITFISDFRRDRSNLYFILFQVLITYWYIDLI